MTTTNTQGAADLIAALKEAQSAINSMKVEAETAAQGDEQMMLEACETISNEGLQADMAIRAALAFAAAQSKQETDATHLRELAAYRLTVENLEREIAAQQPAPSPAPAGWKLVPVEPTEEMLKAADDGDDAYTLRCFGPGVQRVMQGPYDHYCAMLDAAPTAQADTPPVHQWDVGYPPIPSLHGGSELWRAIGKHRRAITGHEIDQAAAQVDSVVMKMLCTYVDADRAARAPADSVLEDAARWVWLVDKFGETTLPVMLENSLPSSYIADGKVSIDAAVDKARKQGEKQ